MGILRVVLDCETDGLENPSKIHCVVTRDIDTGELHVFEDRGSFLEFSKDITYIIGHNLLGFDVPCLNNLWGWFPSADVLDTLILSRLLNYSIVGGHSLETWGLRLGENKTGLDITDWSQYTPEIRDRCIQDTAVNLRLFRRFEKYVLDPKWQQSIEVEHELQKLCNGLHTNGFCFDYVRAMDLLSGLCSSLRPLDEDLKTAFPPKVKLERQITPRRTKSGDLNLNDFRWTDGSDITTYNGGPFSLLTLEEFNPASPKQIVERLNEAGWRPTEKTKGHVEALKDRKIDKERLQQFKTYGWKISEQNLKTLPPEAPEAARTLVRRLLLASRISDLEEWIALAKEDNESINRIRFPEKRWIQRHQTLETEGYHKAFREDSDRIQEDSERERKSDICSEELFSVHGKFNGIGAWSGRMSHQKPNMANIPVAKRSDKDSVFETEVNDINDSMRQLWIARPGHKLIGVDADGIQMRVFAHYVNDERLKNALISGDKEKRTDIHSLHQEALGNACKGRDASKTFIYAWLLGAGISKVASILESSVSDAKEAINLFLDYYPGLKELKTSIIPTDAKRGYFSGLDGRLVACSNEHLMLAGYLQNGEKVIMARAAVLANRILTERRIPYIFRNFVHDELIFEVPDNGIADLAQGIIEGCIVAQGDSLKLNCPLAATGKQGYSWSEIH